MSAVMQCDAKKKKKETEIRKKNLLRLLRCLRPHLHQGIDKRITRKSEEHADSRVSPAVVVVKNVEREEVIATSGVLAHAALIESIRVDEIVPCARASHVGCQVFTARLSLGRVEDSEFGLLALDLTVEIDEGQ